MKPLIILLLSLAIATNLFAQPAISSFSPASGAIGSSVTITGKNFNTTATQDIVFFGATRATVTAATTTSLKVTVPPGATYQYISVTNLSTGLTAYSATPFNVTLLGNVSFVPKVDFATNNSPYSVRISDIDGDGKPDLVVLNNINNMVAVFLNISTASSVKLAAEVDFATGNNPYSISIGDIDGDGKPDLAIINADDNTVSVLRNTSTPGAVKFATKVDFITGNRPYSVSIGDVDGDGKPDLAVANLYSNTVSVLRNISKPGIVGFAVKMDFATGRTPRSVCIGDMDGDGKPDLSVLNYTSGTVSVLHNTSTLGSIGFAGKVDFKTNLFSYFLTIGDVDGDGNPDLMLANTLDRTVSVLLNTSTASSLSFAAKVDFATGELPFEIALSDVDGDGKPDLAVANHNSTTVSVFRNTSTAGYLSFAPKIDFATGGGPASISIGDIDGDGSPDMVVANINDHTISILQQCTLPAISSAAIPGQVQLIGGIFTPISVTATGQGLTYQWYKNTSNSNIGGTALAAINGAQTSRYTPQTTIAGTCFYYCVVTGACQTSQITAISGAFVVNAGPPPTISSFTPAMGAIGSTVTITGTNFNTTPAQDIVFFGATRATVTAATATSLTVTVPLEATYQYISVTNLAKVLTAYSATPFTVTLAGNISFLGGLNFATGLSPSSISISDIDGDGKADLAVVNSEDNTVSILRNISTAGTVSFARTADFATGIGSSSVSIGDIDGDGKPDVVVSNFTDNTISVLRNTSLSGTISFAAKVDFATGITPGSVSIGDIDGDGKPDLVVIPFNSNIISVLRNTSTTGTVSFAAKVDFVTRNGPKSVSIGDIDGDGKPDLAVANSYDNTVSILRNISTAGTVSLAAKVNFSTGIYPVSIIIGDIDGDGKPDLAVVNNSSKTLSVLRNTSTAGIINFSPKRDLVTGPGPRSVIVGDINGDGKPDLVIAYYGNNTISVVGNTSTPGALSFATKVDIVTNSPSLSISIGDLNGDGKPDLAVVNSNNDNISVIQQCMGATTISNGSIVGQTQVVGGIFTPITVTATGSALTYQWYTNIDNSNTGGTSLAAANGAQTNSYTPQTIIIGTSYYYCLVTGACGTAQTTVVSGAFVVNAGPPPTISSFTPAMGAIGSTVIITGTNFNTTPAQDIVFFGATRATVTAATTTSLTVTVPLEATYQYISVTNLVKVLTAYSATPFTVTLPGSTGFMPKADFATGTSPVLVTTGDMDGDGKADVLVANSASKTVSVLLNTSTAGTVSFAPKVDLITGGGPQSVSVGDINGDGKPDLVIADFNSNTVSVLGNTSTPGTVSFATKVDFATGINPISVSIGDLDGDGKPDLAVANYNNNTVSVLQNTSAAGSINFAAKIDYVASTNPYSISIGDLDGDGAVDLAVANKNDNTVSVFRNISTAGTIGFATKINFTTGSRPQSVSIGDIDGDGKADMIVPDFYDNTVSVLRNTSVKGAISFATKTDFATGAGPFSVSIGDIDGDGKPDLAVANSSSNRVSVLRNTSTAASVSFATKADFITGIAPLSVSISDIDGDGKPDLVVVNTGSNTVSVIQQSFVPVISSFTPAMGAIGSMVTISGKNFNANAAQDIVFFGATRAKVITATVSSLTVAVPLDATYQYISVTNLAGSLTAYSAAPFKVTLAGNIIFAAKTDIITGTHPYAVSAGDIDGDGKADLVVADQSASTVSVLLNTSIGGSVSFAPKVDFATGGGPVSVSIGDINGDGKPDLVVTNTQSTTVSVLRNTSTAGAVSFAPKVDFITGSYPYSVSIGDVDGDGKPDLAVANLFVNTVSLFLNTSTLSTISFAPKADFATGGGPVSVSIGDINGDGKPDLAVANKNDNTVSVLLNTSTTGAIVFAPKVDFKTGTTPQSVSIGDIDGDGKPDLAVANNSSNTVSVLRNTSTSGIVNFAAKADFATGATPVFVSIGDIDGDGKADLAVSNGSSNTVSVLRNNSTPGVVSFVAKTDFSTTGYAQSISIGDIDGDGKPDLAVANGGGNTVSVIRQLAPGQTRRLNDSNLAKFAAIEGQAGFIISPNPVTGGSISLQFKNLASGSYSLRLINNMGQTVFTSLLQHPGGSSTQTVNLPVGIARGTYQAELQSIDGTIGTQTILINTKN